MPDSEMFKIVLQGGSFALLAVFVLWVLFKGGPGFKEAIENINEQWSTTVGQMTKDHKEALDSMARNHKEAIAQMAKDHRETITALHKECREERAALTKSLFDERDKDREARTVVADKFQNAINKMNTNTGKRGVHPEESK